MNPEFAAERPDETPADMDRNEPIECEPTEGPHRTFNLLGRPEFITKISECYQSEKRDFHNEAFYNEHGEVVDIPLVDEMFQLPDGTTFRATRFGGVYVSDYLAFPNDENVDAGVYQQLNDQCSLRGSDALWLSNVPLESALFQAAKSASLPNVHLIENIPTRGITCQESFLGWANTRSRNTRRKMKRRLQQLETTAHEGGDSVNFTIKNLDQASLGALLEAQGQRAPRKGYDTISENQEFSAFLSSLVNNEQTKIAELAVGSRGVAWLLFFQQDKTIATYIHTFDEDMASMSPGFLAYIKLISYAHQQGYDFIDLLRGDEDYKRSLTDTETQMTKIVHILNPDADTEKILSFINDQEE